ncbi:MAG: ArnT family glycosyltransferase [Burkholderiaceae bacterium]
MIRFIERSFVDSRAARRSFLLVLLLMTALRAVLAARLPITGDEAYFLYWGRYPDWGFYDHPPMVGWWLAALDAVSSHLFVLRLPALLVVPVVAMIGWQLLRRHGEALAWTGATLLLLVPLNAWNVAITTDIPLMFFSALTVWLYLRACRSGRSLDYLLTGLALAGALLSKYFAGLLALAIFAHAVSRPGRGRFVGLAWVVAGALPAAIVQIVWNAQNCWPNVMFNLINRNETAGWSWQSPPLYAFCVAYVLTPAVAWRLLRPKIDPGSTLAPASASAPPSAPASALASTPMPSPAGTAADDRRALQWLAAVPFLLFAALSLVKTIGLHWLASFVLPAVAAYMLGASRRAQARALAFAGLFAAAHWLLIGIISVLPTETFKSWRSYPGLVMTVHGDELSAALAPYRGRFAIASDGYSPAVTMGYNLGEYVFVFGPGSSHARHDDILTDFRRLEGRDILVVLRTPPALDEAYRPYFESVQTRRIEIRGAAFHLVEGRGFRYETYRDRVLDEVRRRYYAVPSWLPPGACYFCDRYFPERACHR